jgi:phospholipase C
MHSPQLRVLTVAAVAVCASMPALAQQPPSTISSDTAPTRTPIKHMVIIVGENRSFDHLFATYRPPSGQTVWNLLSEGIVRSDGSSGPNYKLAIQNTATQPDNTYQQSPTIIGPYATLPPPFTDSAPEQPSNTKPPPFATITAAQVADYGIEANDLYLLITGATGLPKGTIDTRITNVNELAPGPYQLTNGKQLTDNDYTGSPVHRFYQMRQQTDCNIAYATPRKLSGCREDLFAWVEATVSAGSDGKPPPGPITEATTKEGAIAMGFYNMAAGDEPYFAALARRYTLADNYHQPFMGGTGADSIMIGAADAYWYSDGHGHPKAPPANQIENPDPQPGTTNYYTQDGYYGGSYSDCSDARAPGVGSVVVYLKSLPYHPNPNCEPGHYYLLNNYDPGYFGNGEVDTIDGFVIPPVSTATIGDVMIAHGMSWAYFGEGWNQYLTNPLDPADVYCNICNPFQYETSIMTDPSVRGAYLKDTQDLYQDIRRGYLPSVSFVKPGELNDGHPDSSKFDIFASFTKKIISMIQSQPQLWRSTAIFVTVDEGGGYYDSGYIQPLDFFGDGTRIPLIVVSPFSTGGRVVHSYSDHASLVKFIEANWSLPPITHRSRDNLPNPVASADNPYVPANPPAIGDLMDMFDFHGGGG